MDDGALGVGIGRWRFGVTLWSSVFQVFTVPVMGIYPPLTLLTGLALWPELVRRAEVLRWLPLRIFVLMLGVHGLSLAWSEDKVLGIRNIAYLLPFLTVFAATYRLAQRRADGYAVRSRYLASRY